ncbi:MAG: J domain-containing protein [Spirochaetaceae bacterium]|nr:J domain-containing protein [Spirochaetaceae bacterium]
MSIFDRLAGVFRSSLDNDWQDARKTRSYGDGDLRQAFEELDDFLSGGGASAGGRGAESAFHGGTARKVKPAVPEALRGDFAELGVDFGADEERCKTAYKQQLKRHHPDRHASHEGDMKKATEKSTRLNAAYERIREWREKSTV